jgi:hypothetical protein
MGTEGFYLNQLIEAKQWSKITCLDPDTVVSLVGFENSLRLANKLVTNDDNLDFSREYAVRLLYSAKQSSPKWKNSWKYEAMLADLCAWAMKFSEGYFAGQRACALASSPLPPELALQVGAGYGGPSPHMSSQKKQELLEYALQDKPYANALYGLKHIYSRLPEYKERFEEILKLIEEQGEDFPEEPFFYPDCICEPFSFEPPFSKYFVLFKTISRQELLQRCKSQRWTELLLLNPTFIVENLSFKDILKLAYKLINTNIDCQRYSVRLLYALRSYNFEAWSKTWFHDVFLGYCCEAAGKYDEQFAAYFYASLDARHARDNRPFTDVSAVPAGLMIALARCAFLPDPSVTFEQAIIWLEGVLKQEMYIDALELLLRIYKATNQIDRAVEVTRTLESVQSQGQYSQLPLPPCLGEDFDSIK